MALPVVNNVVNDVADSTPISYNAGTGTDRVLVVVIGMAWASDNAINSLTYGGTALTRAGLKNDPYEWGRVEVWYLLNPASGANNLAISSGDNSVAPLTMAYISGADVTGLGTGSGNANGESTALSVAITPQVATSLLIGGFVLGDDSRTLSAVAGTTLNGQSGAVVRVGFASKPAASTSSHTIALTASGSDAWGALAIEIKAAPVATRRIFVVS